MIGFATDKMIPALQDIWNACFGDEAAYTRFLFDRLLRPENILVYTDGEGRPMAMLCLEPFTLASPKGDCEGAYVYGVATAPEYQGRGLSTALLNDCHRYLEGEGMALSALVPAGEGLFEFYGKRGYETAFHLQKTELEAARIPDADTACVLAPAPLESLAALRDSHYSDRAQFVRWRPEYLAYIGDECRMLGGEVLRVGCAGRSGYAVCYRAKDLVIVKELAVAQELFGDVMAALHARFSAARYQLYLPADFGQNTNKVLPFAMVRWYDKEIRDRLRPAGGAAPWIAHVLD